MKSSFSKICSSNYTDNCFKTHVTEFILHHRGCTLSQRFLRRQFLGKWEKSPSFLKYNASFHFFVNFLDEMTKYLVI